MHRKPLIISVIFDMYRRISGSAPRIPRGSRPVFPARAFDPETVDVRLYFGHTRLTGREGAVSPDLVPDRLPEPAAPALAAAG